MRFRLLAFACAVAALSVPAFAASRNFTVTGFDRIRVDGPFMVRVSTGVAPFARAEGKPAALNGVSIEVQGQTLVVRRNPSGWGGYPGETPGPIEIEVGTHDLSTVWVNGAGSIAIDKAKGQSFDLSVQGPGSVSIGRLTVDRLKAGITGSGTATVGGTAAQVTAIARGTSTFDGSGLTSKDATIGAEGTAVVKLIATGTAKIDSLGTATVEIAGRPACTVRAVGSAVVSGCR
jgi:hypothetical protein